MKCCHRVLSVLCVVSIGCSSQPDFISQREAAQEIVELAMEEFKNGNAQPAFARFTEALKSGGVDRDQMYGVCRHRAICAAKLGDFETARLDLLTMEELTPSLADLLLVHTYVLEKQGKTAQAKATFRRAKSMNSKVAPIKY